MANSIKVIVLVLKWKIENYKLIFHLIEILSDYFSLCKDILLSIRKCV